LILAMPPAHPPWRHMDLPFLAFPHRSLHPALRVASK
jgi:hypothetical protein